jgi:SpoVK/Ycf46/Vps4 family AAA+-type ATPase
MKQPSSPSRPAGAASRPGVRLPAKDLARVRAIAARTKARVSSNHRVLLFCGTNAAAAAAALARVLRRDLYPVDLAAVVSKYIGDTEKNLASVFARAEAAGAILVFDEADALFGKRTEVKDSHGRHAKLVIDDLLRRAKHHDAPVVLVSKPRLILPLALQRRILVYRFPPH